LETFADYTTNNSAAIATMQTPSNGISAELDLQKYMSLKSSCDLIYT